MTTGGSVVVTPPFPLSLPLFIAFCRILPTNVVICRLQSIAHYTLRSAKRVQGGFPLTPFTKCALILNLRLSVRPAELSPTGFRHRPQGRFKPSGTNCPSVLISYHAKASCQWWLRHFLQAKKQAIAALLLRRGI